MSSPESPIKARARGGDPSASLYLPTWKRLRRGTSQLAAMTQSPGCTLVFGESNVLVDPFCDALRRLDSVVIRVEQGERFARLERQLFSVRPCSDDDLGLLLDTVQAEFGSVARIYHLWNVDIEKRRPLSEDMLDVGFHSVIAIARTISATSDAKLALHVVASGMEDVTGLDDIYPERATLEGPCKVIPLEYPSITCRLIDVPPVLNDEMANRLIRLVLSDSLVEGDGNVIALRGMHQWVRTYQPVSNDIGPKVSLRINGVYLITGGFGGVGLCLARYLAQTYQARIILLGRNVATPEHQQTLRDLEAIGGKTLAVTADVGDEAQLRAAIEVVTQRFGPLHGVIHAAGIAGGGMMATRTREAMERVLAPKLVGSINLLAAVSGQTPDFVLLCSSMTAITGGFGQVDYCAANCAQDSIAWNALHQQATNVFSVNWDVWRGLGMAASQTLPLGIGIAPEEGGRLLEAVLAAGPGQTLVSTIDIARQFERVRAPTLADEVLPSPIPSRAQHARPSLSTPFVEPAGDLELSLSKLWCEFLGIAPIGVTDNFFELGGDSLLAIRVLAKTRADFGVSIEPAAFLKHPTISALAVAVEICLIEEIDKAGLEQGASNSAATSL